MSTKSNIFDPSALHLLTDAYDHGWIWCSIRKTIVALQTFRSPNFFIKDVKRLWSFVWRQMQEVLADKGGWSQRFKHRMAATDVSSFPNSWQMHTNMPHWYALHPKYFVAVPSKPSPARDPKHTPSLILPCKGWFACVKDLEYEEGHKKFRERKWRGVVACDYNNVYASMSGYHGRAVAEERAHGESDYHENARVAL